MPHTVSFADLSLSVSIETDPPLDGFDLATPEPGTDGLFEWQIEHTALDGEGLLVGWSLRRCDGAPFDLVGCTVTTGVPAVDVHRAFVPVLHEAIGKRDLISLPWGVDERTFTSWSFPLIALLNRDDDNRFCMAFMDHVHTAHVRQSCYDEDARVELERAPLRTTEWRDGIYLSRAPRHVFDEVRAFARTYDRFHRIELAGVPDAAWDPVWCSWYGIKTDVDADCIRGMAPLLAAWGFGSIIVDAGWFVPGRFDEEAGLHAVDETKFPDMAGLAREVQARGLKFILWCAPLSHVREIDHPFVRAHLFHPEGQEHPDDFLCARCPQVRAYAARTLAHLMRSHGIDGLKIDSVDPYRERSALPCRASHTHDIVDYGEAVQALLADIHRAVTDVRADALIEFRMNYSTLATRPYATSHRTQDAPFDFDHIRRMCTRLRSWILDPEAGRAGNVAAHTDPAYWLPEEPVENVARFMASLITSAVPMLSMDLRALPAEHQRLIRAWLDFYRRHRDLLLFGQHRVLGADPHHSLFSVHRGEEALWGVFTPDIPGHFALPSSAVRRLWILNGGSRQRLYCRIDGWECREVQTRICDRALAEQQSLTVTVEGGTVRLDLDIEIGGAVELTAPA